MKNTYQLILIASELIFGFPKEKSFLQQDTKKKFNQ
jgi:hypothetical protein